MKPKHVIALILLLVGSNIFTFATTRYLTTRDVLTTAQQRMESALKKEGLYDQVYPSDRPRSVALALAIHEAGGMYYWWNEGLLYWGLGGLLAIAGALVPLVQSRRQHVA
jgi:hypothetical protein